MLLKRGVVKKLFSCSLNLDKTVFQNRKNKRQRQDTKNKTTKLESNMSFIPTYRIYSLSSSSPLIFIFSFFFAFFIFLFFITFSFLLSLLHIILLHPRAQWVSTRLRAKTPNQEKGFVCRHVGPLSRGPSPTPHACFPVFFWKKQKFTKLTCSKQLGAMKRAAQEVAKSTQLAIFRNQEKGVFSKGGFCRVQCHSKGNKRYWGYWAQQYIWQSERHSQKRRIFSQKHPSKNPLFLVPEIFHRDSQDTKMNLPQKRTQHFFFPCYFASRCTCELVFARLGKRISPTTGGRFYYLLNRQDPFESQ